MINIIGQIYDSLKTLISTNIDDYIDSINQNEDDDTVFIKPFVDIYRESIDIYKLPAYPALVFGYGEISFDDTHPTTHERWIIPVSLYAVSSGGNAEILQKHSESYTFALASLLWGEAFSYGILYTTGMGVSPALSRTNQRIQVGYVDLNIEVQIQRDQI